MQTVSCNLLKLLNLDCASAAEVGASLVWLLYSAIGNLDRFPRSAV